jgi:4-hydroxythreonine-4-phosphate dehydrogenase
MKPIALTIGEPAGVGPEISVAARRILGDEVPFFLIGDPGHFPSTAQLDIIHTPADCLSSPAGALPVLPHAFPGPVRPGVPVPAYASDVIAVIERAVRLVRGGEAAALVTNPINKAVLKAGAGFAYPGHTEFLAALAGPDVQPVMMLASPALRIVPVTIHVPLADVPRLLTRELIASTLRITHAALRRDFGIEAPRIAVTGLNPHAGEGGIMGREEIEVIAPVVDELRAEGLDLTGPASAVTMFHAAARLGYDAAVAMYHDQALIPAKSLAFEEAVNVTLGLPFIRTSPDHGTAFDIAGKGYANPSSLVAALRMASAMARSRHAD